jgi:hypothetical protein
MHDVARTVALLIPETMVAASRHDELSILMSGPF